MYTRIHVLTIPLTLDVPTAHRTILQVLLRRRADGPLVVREGDGNLTLWLKSCGPHDRKSTESSNMAFLPPSHSALHRLYFFWRP